MRDRRSPIALVVAAALATAAVAAVSQWQGVQSDLSPQYRAFSRYPSTQVDDVVDSHWEPLRAQYGLYTDLHRHAPGAVLTVPRDVNVSVEQLYGLSRLRDVRIVNELDVGVDVQRLAALQADAVASGDDRAIGPYAIAVTPDGQDLVAVEGPDGLLVVDRALLEEAGAGDG